MKEPITIDPMQCGDVFCSGVARVEKLAGDCIRLVIYSEHCRHGQSERVIVAQMVWPIACFYEAQTQITAALEGIVGLLM
jgi:hypothetical protein